MDPALAQEPSEEIPPRAEVLAQVSRIDDDHALRIPRRPQAPDSTTERVVCGRPSFVPSVTVAGGSTKHERPANTDLDEASDPVVSGGSHVHLHMTPCEPPFCGGTPVRVKRFMLAPKRTRGRFAAVEAEVGMRTCGAIRRTRRSTAARGVVRLPDHLHPGAAGKLTEHAVSPGRQTGNAQSHRPD